MGGCWASGSPTLDPQSIQPPRDQPVAPVTLGLTGVQCLLGSLFVDRLGREERTTAAGAFGKLLKPRFGCSVKANRECIRVHMFTV